ncbi:hypothetical protein D6D10_07397 [Aureobasidium pullulans]|uniref:Uncharacterized protein n=1 Tax=Aureobasidium pullulans TaxID=5580 RepID=A0A4S9ELG6_AURPU|nr:hypothetical protein D6D10_07397 [Aureobasidium pullulans]
MRGSSSRKKKRAQASIKSSRSLAIARDSNLDNMSTPYSLAMTTPPSPLGVFDILPSEVRDTIYSFALVINDGWWNDTSVYINRYKTYPEFGFERDDIDARVFLGCLPLMQTSKLVRRECFATLLRDQDIQKPDGVRLWSLLAELSKQGNLARHTRAVGVAMAHLSIPIERFRWIPKQVYELKRCLHDFEVPAHRYFLEIFYGAVSVDYDSQGRAIGLLDRDFGLSKRVANSYYRMWNVRSVTIKLWLNDLDASIRALDKLCDDRDKLLQEEHGICTSWVNRLVATEKEKMEVRAELDSAIPWVRKQMDDLRTYHISRIEHVDRLWKSNHIDELDF